MGSATERPGLVLLSGGLDSTVALLLAIRERGEVSALTVDYGQRGRQEIRAAKRVAKPAGVEHSVIRMRLPESAGELVRRSGRLARIEHRGTAFLAGRNLFLLGAAVATSGGRKDLYLGTHREDAYGDASRDYFDRVEGLFSVGELRDVGIMTPLIDVTKSDVVRIGIEIGAPLGMSWSCYEMASVPCGTCLACRSRAKAFADNGIVDSNFSDV